MITPILIFDSNEKWFPVGVEESLEAVGVEFEDEPLNFPSTMRQPKLPPVGYHRVVAEENVWWHLFGFWYLYNPKTYGPGVGRHEGDWEWVILGCNDKAGNHPFCVYGSQHQNGASRVAWKCERRPKARDGRPVIYVAEGSHANYLGPVDNLEDTADGKGRVLDDIEWRGFGLWADRPWRWGNSHNSPGPLSTRVIWRHPAIAYGQAR
jgi:hypothetical protein